MSDILKHVYFIQGRCEKALSTNVLICNHIVNNYPNRKG